MVAELDMAGPDPGPPDAVNDDHKNCQGNGAAVVVDSSEPASLIQDEAISYDLHIAINGYPKRRRSSTGPIKTAVTPKPIKTPGWCVLCERPIGEEYDGHLDVAGGVVCRRSRCQRSFHLACLSENNTEVSDPDAFLCPPCCKNQELCPECQKPLESGESPRLCPARGCFRQYHAECWKWGDDATCPLHECRKCAQLNVEGESRTFLFRHDKHSCVRCATCYHVSCIPKTAVRLELGNNRRNLYFVCERHEPFPNSIRWNEGLIAPYWIGACVLSELSFSLPPDWLNETEDVGDDGDEESVIIYPQTLSSVSVQAQTRVKPKKKSVPKVAEKAKKAKPSSVRSKVSVSKKKGSKKRVEDEGVETSAEGGEVVQEGRAAYLNNLEFIPEFSTEPPPGFVMEPYQRRMRNLYVQPRANWREEAHICSCAIGMDCADDSCVNRSLQIECDARFCPCSDRCQNQRLQKRDWKPMRLVFTKDRGCGMMSQVPIKAGDLVIEYVGEVLDEFTLRERILENTLKKRPQDNYYMMQLTRNRVIDAKKTGNQARFLNHSCSPNCRTEIWEVAKGELRAGIFAMYDIPAGVELTYDYNFELFSKAVNSDRVPCRCGAKNCSKFLGARALRPNSKKSTSAVGEKAES